MPIKWIRYNRKRYTLDQVLKQKVLEDVYPTPYIHAAIEERKWEKIPSVTQCLNGTREEYLKITTDYEIKLDDRVFSIMGTAGHSVLEKSAKEMGLSSEVRMYSHGMTGQRDLLEEYDGYHRLVDFKFIGAFKAKLLHDDTTKDNAWHEYAMQLNMYRIMVQNNPEEKRELHPEKPCWLFGLIRDAGAYASRALNVNYKTFFTPAPMYTDDEVLEYFHNKRDKLINAIKRDILPPLCSPRETWEGRKCKSFCNVRKECKKHERISGQTT